MEKSFKVVGKKLLKEAFLQDIKKLGYKPLGAATDRTIIHEDDVEIIKPSRFTDTYEVNRGATTEITYNLPEQYQEALDAFRDAIQPVKQKSEELYTIVEFTPVEGCGLAAFYLRPNGKYSTRKDEDACLLRQDALMVSNDSVADGTYKITKIRRNSDGVEFGVGDKIVWNWVISGYDWYTIKEFVLENSVLFMRSAEDKHPESKQPVNEVIKNWKARHYQEEQKKTEYVITAFMPIGISNKGLYSIRENGEYSTKDGYVAFSKDAMLSHGACVKTGHFRIESVKVQDTGIEYTIGDKIKTPGTHSNDVQVITEFVINEYGNCMVKTAAFSKHGIGIGKIVKVEPLFTTYDGVDVWDRTTKVWCVNQYNDRDDRSRQVVEIGDWVWNKKAYYYQSSKWKTFSSEAAMDKYLESIKPKVPVLVTEDGVEVFDKDQMLFDLSTNNWWMGKTPAEIAAGILKGAKHRKMFSTETARAEYSKYNKPVLCLNDLINMDEHSWVTKFLIDKDKTEVLIAEKLKSN